MLIKILQILMRTCEWVPKWHRHFSTGRRFITVRHFRTVCQICTILAWEFLSSRRHFITVHYFSTVSHFYMGVTFAWCHFCTEITFPRCYFSMVGHFCTEPYFCTYRRFLTKRFINFLLN